ncbi:metallophosphoesterase [soil metagenome]
MDREEEQVSGRTSDGSRHGRRASDRQSDVVRVAAVGDFHCGVDDGGTYRAAFAGVNDKADVLLLAGDLTRWGTPQEMRIALGELADVRIPMVAVLGNHDLESGNEDELCGLLREHGVHHLDGEAYVLNENVGIAGVKGFMGGFGRGTLTAFGEQEIKTFVEASLKEVQKLELAMRGLSTPVKIALMHYAPVVDTVIGEPEQIFPYLGTDRLAEPLDRYRASVAFHGHAHGGSFSGATTGGVPVFNVSHSLLQREGIAEMYYVHEIEIEPEIRAEREEAQSAGSLR